MIASHLMFMAELLGRESARRRSNESEDRPVSPIRRLVSVIGDQLRKQSPPVELSNHMRRDIGLEPLPQRSEWIW